MSAKRWLLYTVNGNGLGHLTRLLALARELRRRSPEAEFLFLTSSEASNLAWQEGFASMKVPSHRSIKEAGLQSGTYLRLVQTVVPNVTACFNPDVLVVDTFPDGACRDLLPVLQWPIRRALVYREQKKGLCARPEFQNLLAQYHRLLVPHPEGTVEAPAPPQVPVEFVGHMLLRSREEALPREEARRRLNLPADRLVVYVGFGGGGDAGYAGLLQWVLEQAGSFPDYHFACASPPLRALSPVGPALPNVSSFRYWPLAECWSAFDGAISAAGYNSAAELLYHGVPTIWVPLDKIADDQRLRASRAVQQGAGWLAPPTDTAALRAALLDLGDAARRSAVADSARMMVPSNGAERAAESLLRWVGA